jgi:hypothetical protein
VELLEAYALLGVAPGASPDEVGAAYRALAKLWHPDLAPSAEGAVRMAALNEAHETIRAAVADGTAPPPAPVEAGNGRPVAGAWLPEDTRRQLGRELVRALERREPVRLVTPAATWASPTALLVVTDRRLLWLHDDAVVDRVRSLRFKDVTAVEQKLSWPRRRRATLRLRTRTGRRLAFAELAPAVAAQVASAVRAAAAPA